MSRVVVLQSCYIPWKGYFDLIRACDLFVFYDNAQYTTRDWRNRNRIKTAQGPQWLTVPVGSKVHRLISEVEIHDSAWQETHWERIRRSYARAPFFKLYEPFLQYVYRGRTWTSLSELNMFLTVHIAREILEIQTRFQPSTDYELTGSSSERLLSVVQQSGSDIYVSGPSARSYLDEEPFRNASIGVEYFDYSGYPEYEQAHPPFLHEVTVLDLLFWTGPDAPQYIWGWRESRPKPSVP